MEDVGDADIVICDNLEHALYLSLKYEFVTPLTSLVVVKPNSATEKGTFGDSDDFADKIVIRSSATTLTSMPKKLIFLVILICSIFTFKNH